MSEIVERIISRAAGSNKTIVLPEGNDERVIKAAVAATKLNIAKIVLLGDENKIRLNINKKYSEKIKILNPQKELKLQNLFASALYDLRRDKGLTIEQARIEVKKPMVFAVMMAKLGYADGVVSGMITPTSDVIRPAFQIIKPKSGVSKVSSFMIMEVPPESGVGSNGVLFFADCGVIIDPSDQDLASIAIETALSAKKLFNIKPKVALLSYSTHSSGVETPSVSKVKSALKIVKQLRPDLIIDGEIQADAAINSAVSRLKCGSGDVLGGKSNVLVFPDINSANISYKLVQRIALTSAIGPILCGLNKPVNDLSRGATSDEMVKVIAITALQAAQI